VLVAAAIYLYTSSSSLKKDSSSPSSDTSPQIDETLPKLEWTGSHLYELDKINIDIFNSYGRKTLDDIPVQDKYKYIDKNYVYSLVDYYKIKSVKIFFSSSSKIIAEMVMKSDMSVKACVSLNELNVDSTKSDLNFKGKIGDDVLSSNDDVVSFKKIDGSLTCDSANSISVYCPNKSKSCPSGSSVNNKITLNIPTDKNASQEDFIRLLPQILKIFSIVLSKCGCVIDDNSTNPFYNKKLKSSDNKEYEMLNDKIKTYYSAPHIRAQGDGRCSFADTSGIFPAWYDEDSSIITGGIEVFGDSPIFRHKGGVITDMTDTRNTVSLVQNITAKDCKRAEVNCSIM
jgi:hypothetical protein